MIELIQGIRDVKIKVNQWKRAGLKVGLVPTMGSLHEGHQSLIERAAKENDKVIVSIFVNPIQFNSASDLEKYPKNIEGDSHICERAGADVIFHPEIREMYMPGFSSYVDMTGLTEELCGRTRDHHFRGVCTVVNKLFNIAQPDKAYFGEKDAQQLAIIKRMVIDLNMNVEVVGCPTVREENGLAKSSRNKHLDPEERRAAICLYEALLLGMELIEKGEDHPRVIEDQIIKYIRKEPLAEIDYVQLVDNETLKPLDTICGEALIAIAVFIGETRLIDNMRCKII